MIVRLCATIPGIQNDVANSLQLSIDTVKENELYDRIKHLADSDQRLEKVERDFEKLQGIVNIHEDVIGNMKATMDETSKEVEQEKKKIDAIQSNQGMLKGILHFRFLTVFQNLLINLLFQRL